MLQLEPVDHVVIVEGSRQRLRLSRQRVEALDVGTLHSLRLHRLLFVLGVLPATFPLGYLSWPGTTARVSGNGAGDAHWVET